MPTILALESSCDDTGAAIIHNGEILSNVVASQEIHKIYGGVVPELASRAHQQNIIPVVDAAIQKAKITKSEINAVAFTQGPGLLGPLLVSNAFAKAFALSLNIPLIGVNHMEAHILAHFIDDPKPDFPFLCLTISGGHTQIVIVHTPNNMEIIGETIDDAVGEAFDKSAKILGLPYPGGPLIDKHAQEGNPSAYKFPISNMEGFNFSFSGIKTSFLYFINENVKNNPNFIAENLADICASLQHTLVETLMKKLKKAAKETKINRIAIAGGVSANSDIRNSLKINAIKEKWQIFIPKFEYCTDNAAMIAMTAHFKYLNKDFCDLNVVPDPRLKMAQKS